MSYILFIVPRFFLFSSESFWGSSIAAEGQAPPTVLMSNKLSCNAAFSEMSDIKTLQINNDKLSLVIYYSFTVFKHFLSCRCNDGGRQ